MYISITQAKRTLIPRRVLFTDAPAAVQSHVREDAIATSDNSPPVDPSVRSPGYGLKELQLVNLCDGLRCSCSVSDDRSGRRERPCSAAPRRSRDSFGCRGEGVEEPPPRPHCGLGGEWCPAGGSGRIPFIVGRCAHAVHAWLFHAPEYRAMRHKVRRLTAATPRKFNITVRIRRLIKGQHESVAKSMVCRAPLEVGDSIILLIIV
mmetsp:Transcript_9096/g.20367  ORF Transcript_9096/g.20367 Transcript_9096/m.20367 type:complete len:206 (+) Transcript_9096:233-850(+)